MTEEQEATTNSEIPSPSFMTPAEDEQNSSQQPTTLTVDDGSAPLSVTPPPSPEPQTSQAEDGDRANNPCLLVFCRFVNKFVVIITYPCMVLFTLVSLILLTFFCIFPTLLCLTVGTCLYYCLMDDPIPLSVLLRYMLSPDADEGSYPASLYPMSQQRPMIVKKLIVRKLLKIEESITESNGSTSKDYPRRHPFPIHLSTENKCLYFSEPLSVEESSSSNDGVAETIEIATDAQPDLRINSNDSSQMSPIDQTASEESPEIVVQTEDSPTTSNATKGDVGPNDLGENEIDNGTKVETVEEESENGGDSFVDKIEEEGATTLNGDEETANEKSPKEVEVEPIPPQADVSEEEELAEDYFGISDPQDRGTTCDICLLEYQVGDTVAWSPNLECRHTYHRDCVLDWLVRKPTCPNCRHDYLKGKNDESV